MPVAVGRKRIWMAQVRVGAMAAARQVSVSLKSAEGVIWVTVSGALPVFVTVMVCAGLRVATAWVLKVSAVGLRVMAGWMAVAAVRSGICQMPRP